MPDEMVTMVADMTHGGVFGTVRKGGTYQVTEREARRIEERTPHLAHRQTEAEAGAKDSTRESDAVDLREVAVADLEAELAKVKDVDLIRSMKAADDRKTAAPKYDARLAELEAE